MTREEYLLSLIVEKYGSVNRFSISCGIPYSTLRCVINRGLEKTTLKTLEQICEKIGISPKDLFQYEQSGEIAKISCMLTSHEEKVLQKYRSSPDMQPAVDKLLGLE